MDNTHVSDELVPGVTEAVVLGGVWTLLLTAETLFS